MMRKLSECRTCVDGVKTKLLPVDKSIPDRLRLCNILSFSSLFVFLNVFVSL